MKKLNFLFTFCLIIISINSLHSQNVFLQGQIAVDNFDPTITTINGSLVIQTYTNSPNPITDLSNLSNLTSIQGALQIISNPNLQRLDGLSNLNSIGSFLSIIGNPELLDLTGLSNLTTLDGEIKIINNDNLQDLNGFSGLTSIPGDLNIGNNASLQNLNGFQNLSTVAGFLRICSNPNLLNITGLQNLTFVGVDLYIYNNASLENISDFLNHGIVIRNLVIRDNPSLLDLNGFFNIGAGDGLYIENNPSLQNLDGLSSLFSLERLIIFNNSSLQNLDGLSNITTIEISMVIEDNNNLVDCCGIRYVLENPSGGGFTVSISNNSTTCDNQNAIIADCSNLYVDPFAQGSNSGKSWIDALTNLQDALAIGTNNTIHIAEGTYLPTVQNGLRGKTFLIPTGTTLKGGYPTGGGTQNPEIHETILSGNIDNNSSIQGDSYHVITLNNVNDVEINSLTIRDGNANDANSFGRSRGGGLYIINSVVELKNVDVKWNKGIRGGGLFASESTVTTRQSTFRNNRADYGGALFYTNASDLKLFRSQVINNSSNNRCALESNNATSTVIKNSLIANNTSTNANTLGIIATNRNVTVEILSSTILGEAKNKNLITYQVGNNDQLDVTINNSIIAHQNPSFNKNMVAYNFNILNLNHNNSYFSGSSTIGNGTNALFADTAGDLLLNTDYTLDECSPAVNAGSDALGTGSQDYFGNPRYYNMIDIGAYEAQTTCLTPRKPMLQDSDDLDVSLFPNPTTDDFTLRIKGEQEEMYVRVYDAFSREIYQEKMQHELTVNTKDWFTGIYYVILTDTTGEIRVSCKVLVQK